MAEEPLFMAIPASDPELRQTVAEAQRSLHTFRQLLRSKDSAKWYPSVKTRLTVGKETAVIWLLVVDDTSAGFVATVFEIPPEFKGVMEDERQCTVPLVELDRESQPILMLHQHLDGSVVTRVHAFRRDENRQLVKGPSPKIRNGVLARKRRLEREDCSIHVTKGNIGACAIEVRLSLFQVTVQGEILIQ